MKEYEELLYLEGENICPYCGSKINGKPTGVFFLFPNGCPNEAHKLWQNSYEYIRGKENESSKI